MERGKVFDGLILDQRPRLNSMALGLCRDRARAQDLVQDTMVKAFASPHLFAEGTDVGAWLGTIMRNTFRTRARVAGREVQDGEGLHAASLTTQPEQLACIELREVAGIMQRLTTDQREALVLIGLDGLTYEDAAESLGVPVGTMKSRVSRAREALVRQVGAA